MSLEYTGLLLVYNKYEQRLMRLDALGNLAGWDVDYYPIFCMFPSGNDFTQTSVAIGYPTLSFKQSQFQVDGQFTEAKGYQYDIYVDNNSKIRYRLRIEDGQGINHKCIYYEDEGYDQSSQAMLATYTFRFDEPINLSNAITNIGRIVLNGAPMKKTYFGLQLDSTGNVILVIDSPLPAGGTPKHVTIVNEKVVDPWMTKVNSVISNLETKINQISSDTLTKYCSR